MYLKILDPARLLYKDYSFYILLFLFLHNISNYINEIINDDLEPRKASYKSFYDSNKKVIDQGIVIYLRYR